VLELKEVYASINEKEIIKGLTLKVNPGEVHAIMGPNGSGKSTISKIIAGHPSYEVNKGSVQYTPAFDSINLLDLEPHERAQAGIFLALQYPIEIPGVSNFEFLRTAFNAVSKHHGVEGMPVKEFEEFVLQKMKNLDMNPSFLHRPVNEGFSGGEKKRNEILQLLVLNPRVAILDETDSGLDIDALKVISNGVNQYKNKNNAVIMITHYQRLLDYIKPDFVHVLAKGRIIKTGDYTLALDLEKRGYDWLTEGLQ
jgi:Fe-S cluster assembly ATP-binding protein